MTAGGELIGVADAASWRRALSDVPHGYWHTHEACLALQEGLDVPLRLFHVRDEGLAAVLSFAERGSGAAKDVFLPAGFGGLACRGDAAEAGRRWRALAADLGYVCGYFPLHPLLVDATAHAGVADAGNDLFTIDLAAGARATIARADRSVRRSLRQPGFTPVHDRGILSDWLQAHYQDFMQAAGANPAAVWPAKTLRRLLADPAVHIFGASDAEGPCAAYAFAATPHGAEALVHVSVRMGRAATSALVAAGIAALSEQGVPWLHLGGGTRRDDAIARAKRKFRPREWPMRVARDIYRPDDFARLSSAAGPIAARDSGYFPPYRQPTMVPDS